MSNNLDFNIIQTNIINNFEIKNKEELINIFTGGGCFAFAYYYNKYFDPNNKIKILFGKYYNSDYDTYSLDIIHTIIEDSDGYHIDITGIHESNILKKYMKRYNCKDKESVSIGDEPEELIIVNFNEYIDNELIDLNFILKLEPHYEGYIDVFNIGIKENEEKWKNVFTF